MNLFPKNSKLQPAARLTQLLGIIDDSSFQTKTHPFKQSELELIYNPIIAMGFLAMFSFQLDNAMR